MRVLLGLWALAVLGGAAPLLPLGRPAVVDFAFAGPEAVAVATGEGVELWRVTGEARQRWPRPGVRALAAGARGERLALALDAGVEVWSVQMGAPTLLWRALDLRSPRDVAMSPEETHVAAHDGVRLCVWEAGPGRLLCCRSAHELQASSIDGLAFLGEDELLISTNRALLLWPVRTPSVRRVADLSRPLPRPVGNALRRWAVLPSARPFDLELVEVDTGKTIRLIRDSGEALGFTPEGELVVWGWKGMELGFHLLSAEGQGTFCALRREIDWSPLRARLSQDGQRAAVLEVTSFSARLRIQGLVSCGRAAVLGRWATELVDCALSADGRHLVAARLGGLEVWDASTRTLRASLDAASLPAQDLLFALYPMIRCVLPHPKRATVAAAFAFVPKVVVWHWEGGGLVDLNLARPYPVLAPATPALALAFTPDGNALIFVHQGGGISCWEWAARSTRWADPREDERSLPLASADGRFVATVGPASLRVRDVATGKVLDERGRGLSVRRGFAMGERDFLLEAEAGWHRLRLSPEGRVLALEPLPQIPAGRGSLAPDGRTLAVLSPYADPFAPASVLWLWDVQGDRVLHRLELPLPGCGQLGGVLLSPEGAWAVLWCSEASLWVLVLREG